MNLDQLIKMRQFLHSKPELSHNEKETALFLIQKIKETNPSKIITQREGYGFWVRYHYNTQALKIAFRADIDALPIQEINSFTHKSICQGVSHKCGHDGHAASLLGFAFSMMDELQNSFELVFQAAEETGTGAQQWLLDRNMAEFSPNKIFAYHNLPSFPLNSIIIRNGVFSAASTGVIIKLNGKTSHAAHPEHGVSPALALSELIFNIENLPKERIFKDFVLTTVVHATLGEVAFGTAPGYAELRATLRSFDNGDLKLMQQKLEDVIHVMAAQYSLRATVEYSEFFPATENDALCVDIVRKAAQKLGLQIIEPEEPFRWSEDFSYFTLRFSGALFGIGAGENHPQLHNPDYDFPDEILSVAVQMFQTIYHIANSYRD